MHYPDKDETVKIITNKLCFCLLLNAVSGRDLRYPGRPKKKIYLTDRQTKYFNKLVRNGYKARQARKLASESSKY